MRHTENYALVFRNYRRIRRPSHGFKQPSAEFSPHILNVISLSNVVFDHYVVRRVCMHMCMFFHPPPESSSLEEDLVASLRICSVRHFEFTATSFRVYCHVIASLLSRHCEFTVMSLRGPQGRGNLLHYMFTSSSSCAERRLRLMKICLSIVFSPM